MNLTMSVAFVFYRAWLMSRLRITRHSLLRWTKLLRSSEAKPYAKAFAAGAVMSSAVIVAVLFSVYQSSQTQQNRNMEIILAELRTLSESLGDINLGVDDLES